MHLHAAPQWISSRITHAKSTMNKAANTVQVKQHNVSIGGALAITQASVSLHWQTTKYVFNQCFTVPQLNVSSNQAAHERTQDHGRRTKMHNEQTRGQYIKDNTMSVQEPSCNVQA